MKSICGKNCDNCDNSRKIKCKGCKLTNGCPFGKQCFIAEYINTGGKENFEEFKKKLIEELNSLNIDGMPKITDLFALNGDYVNLSFPLSNGSKVKFLNDDEIYLGNQVECEFNEDKNKECFGLVANMDFLLICRYGENGENPEIVIYKKR